MMTCTSKSSIPCQSTPFHLPAYQCELLATLLLLMCRGKHCLLPLRCLKCQLCHFRQVILQSYLLRSPVDNRITNRYNGGGRIVSDIWTYFSNADNPQKLKSAICKHCKVVIHHQMKSERAKQHLLKCSAFRSLLKRLPEENRPSWYPSLPSSNIDKHPVSSRVEIDTKLNQTQV